MVIKFESIYKQKKEGAGSLPHLHIISKHPESSGVLGADTHLVVSAPLFIAHTENDVVASSNADSFTIHSIADVPLSNLDTGSDWEGH